MSGAGKPDERERLILPLTDDLGAGQGGEYRAFAVPDNFHVFPAMLEIQFRTGNRSAFAYHTLGRVEFDPSVGITLAFSDLVVTLSGRCLDTLFVAIRSQQAVFVCEADRATSELTPAAVPLVEMVKVEPGPRGRIGSTTW